MNRLTLIKLLRVRKLIADMRCAAGGVNSLRLHEKYPLADRQEMALRSVIHLTTRAFNVLRWKELSP